MYVQDMIRTSPAEAPMNIEALAECIETCFECAQTCSACADACLGEEQVTQLTACITLNEVCADVCATTGAALSRIAHAAVIPTRSLLDACADACARCAEECERHAEHMEHCRVCAEACRRCENACRELLSQEAA